jgi:hypothetical protein
MTSVCIIYADADSLLLALLLNIIFYFGLLSHLFTATGTIKSCQEGVKILGILTVSEGQKKHHIICDPFLPNSPRMRKELLSEINDRM